MISDTQNQASFWRMELIKAMITVTNVGVSKNGGNYPKMDGENNGSKPYFLMDDLGGTVPLFLEGHPFAKRHKFFTSRAVIDAMRQAFGSKRFVVRDRLPVDWSHSASNLTKKTLGKSTS